jgi:hypothetical protein
MNLQFGTGVLDGVPNAGNLATNPTPTRFGLLQEASVTFKADLKKLFGQKQFAAAKARGKIDVSVKAKIASYDPNMLAQLYWGQPTVAGVQRRVLDESHVPAASVTPTQITAGVDYGVINKDTGLNMTKIASGSPTVGQYKFTPYNATGPVDAAYVFNASETASAVLINYTYPDTSNGTTLILNNQLMGYAPEFIAFLFNAFRGKYFGLQLNSCTMGEMSIPTKQEDFWMSDITFDASTDASDELGRLYLDS